jgi:hypothetical protein
MAIEEQIQNLDNRLHNLELRVSKLENPIPTPEIRRPKFIWSQEWQDNYERMAKENHPWWQLIKSNADKTGTTAERYGDNGQWATFVYQVTGDITYAKKAIPQAIALAKPASANHVREHIINALVMYDWLLPAMTAEDILTFNTGLKTVAEYILGINQEKYTGGISLSDSDALIGCYFSLALMDLLLETDYLSETLQAPHLAKKPIGGLVATGIDKETVRNTISDYTNKAKGGQWIESSEYNLGTNHLLLMGSTAVKTATGQDYFPEVTQYFEELKQSMLAELTPDIKQAFQWGDVESPHSLDKDHRNRLLLSLGLNGILPVDNNIPHRTFYFANPYLPNTIIPPKQINNAEGIGLLLIKDETKLFGSLTFNPTGAHHGVKHLNDFRLYTNGEWVIDHPIGYGRDTGKHVNSMLLAGLSACYNRGLQNIFIDENIGYYCQVGETGGPYYNNDYYNPPPTFLRKWRRYIIYLPEYPAVVVYDSIDMDDPKLLLKFDRYRTADQTAINNAIALKQWFLHTPVVPIIQDEKIIWTTPKGQSVILQTLAPQNYNIEIVDAKTDPAFSSGFKATEPKFYINISSNIETEFINIISINNTPMISLINNKLTIGNHSILFDTVPLVNRI